MKELLKRLNELGVTVTLHSSTSVWSNDIYYLSLPAYLTQEEVKTRMENRIKNIEERPWLQEIEHLNQVKSNICLECKNYMFNIVSRIDRGKMQTVETCTAKHFTQIDKNDHEPVTVCKDYLSLEIHCKKDTATPPWEDDVDLNTK